METLEVDMHFAARLLHEAGDVVRAINQYYDNITLSNKGAASLIV